MTDGSIRFRLWSAATISILVALASAGVGLRYLFERHVERRIQSELTVDLNSLIGSTTFNAANQLEVTPILTDPRFKTPLSGYYWQVEDVASGTVVRSRSLWDRKLTLSPENDDGTRRINEIIGPEGSLLIAVDRTIVDTNGHSFHAAVAEDHRTVEASVSEYVGELAPAIILLACFLIMAIFIQITVGLAPLDNLRVAVRD